MSNDIQKILNSLREQNDDNDWMDDAVKKPGKLKRDLGVPEDEDIYQSASISDVVEYANKSTKNMRRVRLAITFSKQRGDRSQEEREFWNSVEDKLDEESDED